MRGGEETSTEGASATALGLAPPESPKLSPQGGGGPGNADSVLPEEQGKGPSLPFRPSPSIS